MATQNLGNVRALIVSTTAPTNTNLLWRDTSVSPYETKIYDTSSNTWVAINTGSGGDASTLDGLTSSQFLRSDIDDTATGVISFDAGILCNQIENLANNIILLSFSNPSTPVFQYRFANNLLAIDVNTNTLSTSIVFDGNSIWHAGNLNPVRRTIATSTIISGGNLILNFDNNEEFLTLFQSSLSGTVDLVINNATNAQVAVIDLNVSAAAVIRINKTLMTVYFQSSETRYAYVDATYNALSLPIGLYKLTFKRTSGLIYTAECSDEYINPTS